MHSTETAQNRDILRSHEVSTSSAHQDAATQRFFDEAYGHTTKSSEAHRQPKGSVSHQYESYRDLRMWFESQSSVPKESSHASAQHKEVAQNSADHTEHHPKSSTSDSYQSYKSLRQWFESQPNKPLPNEAKLDSRAFSSAMATKDLPILEITGIGRPTDSQHSAHQAFK